MLSFAAPALALALFGSSALASPANTLEKRRVIVQTNTCVRVNQAVSVHQQVGYSPFFQYVNVDLDLGECICIAPQPGSSFPLNVKDGVEVLTANHGTVTGGVASSLAAHILGSSLSFYGANLFNFPSVGFCTVDNIDFSNTEYSFPSTGSCCSTQCISGDEYYNGNCVPKCASGQTRCSDGTCQTACPTSGLNHHKRDASRCPPNLTSCPLPKTGSGRQAFECVDTTSDIESCGGCQPFSGEDCTAIPHTSHVACYGGQCAIKSCQRGYQLAANGTSCERVSNSKLLQTYTRQRAGLKIQA